MLQLLLPVLTEFVVKQQQLILTLNLQLGMEIYGVTELQTVQLKQYLMGITLQQEI